MERNSSSILAGTLALSVILSSGGKPQTAGETTGARPQTQTTKGRGSGRGGSAPDELGTRADAKKRYEESLQRLIERDCPLVNGKSQCDISPDNFFIAIVPDPVHTHLALTFDRRLEAIQEALQDEGYNYAASVMPWDSRPHPESDEVAERVAALEYERGKQEYPGLMTFRGDKPLFVFVVGETPTNGVNAQQFENAIQQIQSRQTARVKSLPEPFPLWILGPSFSGSLKSMEFALKKCDKYYSFASMHSGSVSGDDAITAFLKHQKDLRAHFVTFQESDKITIARFIKYVTGKHGKVDEERKKIAIVSEDETAYGSGENKDQSVGLRLFFPREVSQLRAAYQKEMAVAEGGSAAPRRILPFTGDVSGEDSVTEYAAGQIALSQEGVMQGIVAELKRHRSHFVIVRATDPMDTLFVSRYLRRAYPEGRVVTIGADMLFRREADDPDMQGLLSLSTYSMAPAGNHDYVDYDITKVDRVFPSSLEAGTYNAMRSLNSGWVDEDPEETGDRITLKNQDDPTGALKLFQFGWRLEKEVPGDDTARAKEYGAPPVRLLALGRDDYWPIAALGPDKDDKPQSRLPIVRGQVLEASDNREVPEPIELPNSWRAVQLIVMGLGVGFCGMLWFSSISSPSQALAKFAPSCADSRVKAIFVGGLALTLITMTLLWPVVHGVPREGLDYALAFSGLLVAGATVLELVIRGRLTREAPVVTWLLVFAFVGLVAGFGYGAVKGEPAAEKLMMLQRFATLRATRLTSGLSFLMPIFFFLSAWLWWSDSVVAGYTLLDERRPQLPRTMTADRLAQLGGRIPTSFETLLKPGIRGYSKYFVILTAIACGLWTVVEWDRLSLEHPRLHWMMIGTFALVLGGVIGATMKLWEIWSHVRTLLGALDSQPLRDGFKTTKGLTWNPIWRLSGGTMAEFQRILSRQREALACALNTEPELDSVKVELEERYDATRDAFRKASAIKHPFSKDWRERRKLEHDVLTEFGKYQEAVANAASKALDLLDKYWKKTKDEAEHPPADEDFKARACERFVCLVYVNFLLAMLTRIRTLTIAIGGMYVLLLIGAIQYPFEPKAILQVLLVVLLVGIVAVVGTVFAEIHRDTTLSHLTDTTPGELGIDFWVRMASFVALPVVTLFASEFPSLSRVVYSWIRPAIESLNH
jgi:hypothetical protein